MNRIIAVIEDDPDISELVALHIEKSGYKARKFRNGSDFFNFLKTDSPIAVILDLMLPDIDGLEICKLLRTTEKTKQIPILILTAKGEEVDRILGLEIGADDYITKPFSPRELVARLKAVLRRYQSPTEEVRIIKIGDLLTIDSEKMEVVVEGRKIELTQKEFSLLKTLASKPGRVFSREELLDIVWGMDSSVIDRTIDVHIKNLREKLGKVGALIKSIRGIGYKLEEI